MAEPLKKLLGKDTTRYCLSYLKQEYKVKPNEMLIMTTTGSKVIKIDKYKWVTDGDTIVLEDL